ncbi:MAG: DUF4258 domain-containing protein [Betaproteobacteria bacterium]
MKITYRVHAIQRMFERGISEADVRWVLSEGDEIASYSDDKPYPSRLLLGWRGGRPVHVVTAYSAKDDEHVVITVYEPNPALWEPDFKRRKP